MAGDCPQYLLPDALGAASASDALAARVTIDVGGLRLVDRTFYDTFDGRLHAAGLVLFHADGRLALLDGAGYTERAGDQRLDPPDRVLALELRGGRLRDLLLPIVGVRALIPVTRIRSRARPLHAVNNDGKTVARLVIEEPTVARSGRPGVRLRPRLLLAPVRGYDGALGRVRRTLERELGLHDRPQAGRPIGDLAGERITAVYRGMVKLGGGIGDASPAAALHELRKKGKELRYLLELFASLYPGTVEFPARFAAFASKPQRARVRRTFG